MLQIVKLYKTLETKNDPVEERVMSRIIVSFFFFYFSFTRNIYNKSLDREYTKIFVCCKYDSKSPLTTVTAQYIEITAFCYF